MDTSSALSEGSRISEAPTSGFVRYQNVNAEYLEKRSLTKKASWLSLWALGVGVVISGEYFGWNFGLAAGGFWGLTIATALMATMYVCMVFCISELTSHCPTPGASTRSPAPRSGRSVASSVASLTPSSTC